jgi:hypothetical protein
MLQLTEEQARALPNGTKVLVQWAKTDTIVEGTWENYYGAYPLIDDVMVGRIADTPDSDLTKVYLPT